MIRNDQLIKIVTGVVLNDAMRHDYCDKHCQIKYQLIGLFH